MALARIRTYFPDEVGELCDALVEAGYTVETLRPDEFRIAPADLELTVDKLPVVDAWRHVPDADEVYVAPGTPESADIRSAFGAEISREPVLARVIVRFSESAVDLWKWYGQQVREARSWTHSLRERQWTEPRKALQSIEEHLQILRARVQELRQRWTPPREYDSSVHLEPSSPVRSEHPEPRIDAAIERARAQAEALRLRKEAEQRELQERARLAEESRRRAREAAEARALLEKQREIDAMVQASAALRERVVGHDLPKPHAVERRRPRVRSHFLPRTRRERAFFRAGVTSLGLSLALAILVAQALHPRPAAGSIPQSNASVAPPQPTNRISGAPSAATAVPASLDAKAPLKDAAAEAAIDATAVAPVTPKPSGMKSVVRRGNEDDMIAGDEVIVRKPRPTHTIVKPKQGIAHYSDLN